MLSKYKSASNFGVNLDKILLKQKIISKKQMFACPYPSIMPFAFYGYRPGYMACRKTGRRKIRKDSRYGRNIKNGCFLFAQDV